jgi:hypothetical protein
MQLCDFFDQVPRLRVRDPLAELLGAAEGGVIEYGFADAVRLTGHACPTVAGAYWLTWLALRHLYGDTVPERGGMRVEFQQCTRSGGTGVVATVVNLLTGAAGSSGFKGIGGRYSRAGLIRYTPDLLLQTRFTRLDTGAAVDASADLGIVPADPRIEPLLARCVQDKAGDDERRQLRTLWQARVRQLLIDLAHDTGVWVLKPVERRSLGTWGRAGAPSPRSWPAPLQQPLAGG